MITAVDTSVLLDIFRGDERHGADSRARLTAAYDAGAVVVCDIVYAELVPAFDDRAPPGGDAAADQRVAVADHHRHRVRGGPALAAVPPSRWTA